MAPSMTVSTAAAALLRLMGKGWTFTPYPATGPQKELQLRNPDGKTVCYVVQGKDATAVTCRYRQHGFVLPAAKPTRKMADAIKAHGTAHAAAQARRTAARKPRLTLAPKAK